MTRTGLRKVQRSRTAVVAALLSFLMLTLLLNLSLDTLHPEWRDAEYGYRLKELKKLIRQEPSKPLVLALGSSRSQMGLNPNKLGLDDVLVYNFSQAGCGPPQQFMNLNRLLSAGVKPNFLLVEILPPVLGNRGPIEKSFLIERMSYADLQATQHYFSTPNALTKDWVERRAVPWHTVRLNLLSHIAPGWLPAKARQDFLWQQMKPFGWMPYVHLTLEEKKRQDGLHMARVQYLPYFAGFTVTDSQRQAHQDILQLAKQHNIRVAFYTLPESPIFRSWYPPEVTAKLQEYYQELTREHSTPVFQASDWLGGEQQFADGHHLMQSGSEQFSTRFGRECLKPWLFSR